MACSSRVHSSASAMLINIVNVDPVNVDSVDTDRTPRTEGEP
jgi:hypothetical protein